MGHSKQLRAKLLTIEKELFKNLQAPSEPQILYEASIHPIRSGGKRLRPLLTLLACEAVGGNFQKALPVATAIELIHTASLIHDDLIDEDRERRGAPTVHTKYGRNVAVLSVDLLTAKAMQIISENSPAKIRRIVAEACIEMCEGEYMDMSFKKSPEAVTEEEYLKMVRKKTGALVKAAAECGAITGGGNTREIKSLSRYGEFLGLSLQLSDDVQEILTAKLCPTVSVSNGLVSQGSNLVLIHSFRNSDRSSQSFLRRLVTSNTDRSGLRAALDVFESSMSIQHVQRMSERFEREARNAMLGMHFHNQRILEDLAKFVSRY